MVIHSREVKWIGKMWAEFYKIKEESEPEETESEVNQVGQSQAEETTEIPVGEADDWSNCNR